MENFKFLLSVLEALDNWEFECLTCQEDAGFFIDLSEDFYRLRATIYTHLRRCLDEKE